MKNQLLFITTLCLTILASCQEKKKVNSKAGKEPQAKQVVEVKQEPHRYGGWYCPDNLFGFPAVNLLDWESVPVVNGRMPTKEETQNGTSLIFVDNEKYPNAKALDLKLPQLARYTNRYTNRTDLIIVIQAVKIQSDSIVGFRFVNGGNGSARLNEVELLSDKEKSTLSNSRFVVDEVELKATPKAIWEILTKEENLVAFDGVFESKAFVSNWRSKTNINFHYPNHGEVTSAYADILFGNYYIQNDYSLNNYSEKFFITENKETNTSNLQIVLGPFESDYLEQQKLIAAWMDRVSVLCNQGPTTR